MSLTKTSAGQYFTIDQFDWTLPCTLEIKFSTVGTGSGSYWENPTILGNEHGGHWAGDWGIATTSGVIYVWFGNGSNGWAGKRVDDGEPHTVRLCIDEKGTVVIYADDVQSGQIGLATPWGTNFLGFNGVDGRSFTQAPTTWYYIKFVHDYIPDRHITRTECDVYYTWDSEGNMNKNGTPISKIDWGEHDDIHLDSYLFYAYHANKDLYAERRKKE